MNSSTFSASEKPTAPTREPLLLPLDEFREMIGNPSRATIYRWEKRGLIKLRRVCGRTFGSVAEAKRLAGDAA